MGGMWPGVGVPSVTLAPPLWLSRARTVCCSVAILGPPYHPAATVCTPALDTPFHARAGAVGKATGWGLRKLFR